MTLLQEFKSVMKLGTWVHWAWNGQEHDVREVMEVRSGRVGFSAAGSTTVSWLDWPKARELSKEGDRYVIVDEDFGIRLEYWLAKEG